MGADARVEKAIAEIRKALDQLDAALKNEGLDDYGFFDVVRDPIAEHDEDIEDACAEMEDLELDDEPVLPSTNIQTPSAGDELQVELPATNIPTPPTGGELQVQAEKLCIFHKMITSQLF